MIEDLNPKQFKDYLDNRAKMGSVKKIAKSNALKGFVYSARRARAHGAARACFVYSARVLVRRAEYTKPLGHYVSWL